MPTANVFYSKKEHLLKLKELAPRLKIYLAEKLTCGDRKLSKDEISVRLVQADGTGMIGAVEVEITAFAYEERVKNQDKICLEVKDFMQKECPELANVNVWLVLAELGHSWKN